MQLVVFLLKHQTIMFFLFVALFWRRLLLRPNSVGVFVFSPVHPFYLSPKYPRQKQHTREHDNLQGSGGLAEILWMHRLL